MKGRNFISVLLIAIAIIIPNVVKAGFINQNGVSISDEDYEKLSKIHTYEYIMTMTQEKYDKLMTLDYEKTQSQTKYIATTYNNKLALITEKEISEEEYNNFEPISIASLGDRGDYIENTVKQLSMIFTGGTVWNYVILTLTWKGIPSTRSYDVIGFRGFNFEFRDGSQEGEQIFKQIGSDKYETIFYEWNGGRIKRFDNGFGMAMNIVNNSINALQLCVEGDVEQTGTYPAIYGSYQHAVSNVSLDQALSFTLNGSGLGRVFAFPDNITPKYDGESGVRIQF